MWIERFQYRWREESFGAESAAVATNQMAALLLASKAHCSE